MNLLVDGEMLLFGTVGDAWYGDFFTAGDVVMALAELGRAADITVRINSGGGIATEGAAIYAALSTHPGKVTVFVEGIAASAASLIAMAGDDIVMRKGAVMMIHDPSGFTMGTAEDHAKGKQALDALGDAYAGIYAAQTGAPAAAARADMREELWLTGEEAVAKGYADRLDESAEAVAAMAFDYRVYAHAPAPMLALAAQTPVKKQRSTLRAVLAGLLPGSKPAKSAQKPVDSPQQEASMPNDPTQPTQPDLRAALAAANDRIKAILTAPEASGRDDLAKQIAFSTDLNVETAIAMLKAAPAGSAPSKTQRLDGSELNHGLRPDADAPAAASTASWDKIAAELNREQASLNHKFITP